MDPALTRTAAAADGGDGASPPERPISNLAELLGRHALTRADEPALVQPGAVRRSMSWAELDRLVSSVSAGLAGTGLVAGQRVVLVGPNTVDFVVAYLAALRSGLVAVPVDPGLPVETIQAIADQSGARLVWDAAGRAFRPTSRPLTSDGLADLADHAHGPVASPPDPESLAVLLFTAGSADDPLDSGWRPVMLSHRALLAHLRHVQTLGIADAETVAVGLLPFCHVFGLNAVLGSWLLGGGRLVVLPQWPESLAAVIAAEAVTNVPISPAGLYRLLHEDGVAEAMRTVRTVVSGAAPLPAELARRFTDVTGHRVEQGYGLTEAAPGVTATLGGSLFGSGHVGRPLPGVEVRIGDQTDQGEPGPIRIRGDNLFSGYWPDGAGGPTSDHGGDGWFDTGDIGYLVDGELFLVDRAAELITVNGFHVYPAEVEQAIAELPGVRSVAVVGRPDERTGERIVAFVAAPGLSVEAIGAHCETRIARFKRPAEIRLLDDLPRGITGKVKKGELRRLADSPC